MKIENVITQLFGENVFVVWDEATLEAAIIDPGMMDAKEYQAVEEIISREKLGVKYVLLTHSHVDHACAARWAAEKFGAQVFGSKKDSMLASSMTAQASLFHLPIQTNSLSIDKDLEDGDELSLGEMKIKVIATPGHTQGGVVFYISQENIAFVGDTIFQRSVGRTDLPGGNLRTLISSIHSKIFELPGNTVLIPGHGPTTTVDDERQNNPYV
ncbi:MAG: MBL fold metallo-hydrolase [Bacteroidales bacterium]|nr:MBL fold metallo-hydrolase [Bacteroidales bacterium]